MGNDVGDKNESGFLIAVIVLMVIFLAILPFMLMIYLDTLKIQKRVEKDMARIEKILKVEEEKK
jgi:Tfp pilus assembly protein PilV